MSTENLAGFCTREGRVGSLGLPCFSMSVTWAKHLCKNPTTLVRRHLKARKAVGPYPSSHIRNGCMDTFQYIRLDDFKIMTILVECNSLVMV
jgi:hypothetical protein